MTLLAEMKSKVAAMPVQDRGSLATYILDQLPESEYDVSDDEVAERARQMQSGEVELLTLDQLRSAVMQDRGRP